ncbi:MAG: hypothetical protein ABR915_00965 [Thermoguttaceae bacterium]
MSEGKTLWEMFRDRMKGEPAIPFYNPLDEVAGLLLSVDFPQYKDYTFTIKEIREYARKLADKTFVFTDYVLEGVKGFDAATAIGLRLRVVPAEPDGKDVILLRLYDEKAYDQGLENVVRDTTGQFEITYDEGELDGSGQPRKKGDTELYARINGNLQSYRANVLVMTEFDKKRQAIVKSAQGVELEYWDYSRDLEENGQKRPQFLFVEMECNTGWFQIWQGEFFEL